MPHPLDSPVLMVSVTAAARTSRPRGSGRPFGVVQEHQVRCLAELGGALFDRSSQSERVEAVAVGEGPDLVEI
ncbi:hypothetical protein EBO15_29650 [Actinomadura harenae]|uniref:Uncharacterized protein n=1 Tax=Actinomadura harenae TaxID=2483351 RepID=A0A3M2LPV0_9ACTN|nr:hypothetical protein EBO15_29650 [Actinomadura harenae]